MQITLKESLALMLLLGILFAQIVNWRAQSNFQDRVDHAILHQRAGDIFAATAQRVCDNFREHQVTQLDAMPPECVRLDEAGVITWAFDYDVPDSIAENQLQSVIVNCVRPFMEELGQMNPNSNLQWNVEINPDPFNVSESSLRQGNVVVVASYSGS